MLQCSKNNRGYLVSWGTYFIKLYFIKLSYIFNDWHKFRTLSVINPIFSNSMNEDAQTGSLRHPRRVFINMFS